MRLFGMLDLPEAVMRPNILLRSVEVTVGNNSTATSAKQWLM
jgi:hypothetical protein